MYTFIKNPEEIIAEQYLTGKEVKGVELHKDCDIRQCPICGGGVVGNITPYVLVGRNILYVHDTDWIVYNKAGAVIDVLSDSTIRRDYTIKS